MPLQALFSLCFNWFNVNMNAFNFVLLNRWLFNKYKGYTICAQAIYCNGFYVGINDRLECFITQKKYNRKMENVLATLNE